MGGTTRTRTVWGGLVIVVVSLLLPGVAIGAGEKVAVFGADLAPAGRQELTQLFGADGSTKSETVTTQEMVAALKDSGLPVAPDDKTISSSALTCLEKGEGLTVRTQNITRIPAAVYANALVTAGVGDASVI